MAGEHTKGFLNPVEVRGRLGIAPGMKVADFGCGAGGFAVLIAQAVEKDGLVTAIDVLPTALESVQSRAKAAGLENIQTVRANLEIVGGSKLPDSSQDIVLAANILIQSTKQEIILEEAKRVLRSGGTLAILEWKNLPAGRQEKPAFGPPNDMRIEPELLKKLLTDAGFAVQSQFEAGEYHYGITAKKP